MNLVNMCSALFQRDSLGDGVGDSCRGDSDGDSIPDYKVLACQTTLKMLSLFCYS